MPGNREEIERLFSVAFLIGVSVSSCTLMSDCPISSGGSVYVLSAGDYPPISAYSRGIFYEVPRSAEVRRGDNSVWISNLGVHFPFGERASSPPMLWVEGVDLERGSPSRVKRWALPQRCWQPYGSTLTVVHSGVEVPSRR